MSQKYFTRKNIAEQVDAKLNQIVDKIDNKLNQLEKGINIFIIFVTYCKILY